MRGGKFTRADYFETSTNSKSGWLDEFAKKLGKEQVTAVEIARQRQQESLSDQIANIMGNKEFPTVESKVRDLQERTGLGEYLRRQSEREMIGKTASMPLLNVSDNVRQNVESYIKNRIETHRGHVPVPAIQEDVILTFKNDGVKPEEVNGQEMAKYISDLILSEQQKYPSDSPDINIGKNVGTQEDLDVDGSNSDFFKGLMPAST